MDGGPEIVLLPTGLFLSQNCREGGPDDFGCLNRRVGPRQLPLELFLPLQFHKHIATVAAQTVAHGESLLDTFSILTETTVAIDALNDAVSCS